MAQPFKLCILFGDTPDRPPAEISAGWEMAEIPVAQQLIPFESNATWARRRTEIRALNLPPIKVSSHFIQGWGLAPLGPGADWDQLAFWTQRAFARLAEIGVEIVGVYGGFFLMPQGFPKTKGIEQALRFVNLLADLAQQHNMVIALEPMADPNTLFPRYMDGVAFAKHVGRPQIRVLADLQYFLRLDQPLADIAKEPQYCVHCHITGEDGQPGIGDREVVHARLFRLLRDIGYEGGVSAACPWVSSHGGKLDFLRETARTLRYLRDLRDMVYSGK